MQISVETHNALQRKINIVIPKNEIQEEVDKKLRKAVNNAKIEGFRPGKAPFEIVKQRYMQSILHEVGSAKIQDTFRDAILAQDLKIASSPHVLPWDINYDADFSYSVIFEVFPTFVIKEPTPDCEVQQISSIVTDEDVDEMIEQLRINDQKWEESEQAAQIKNKLVIDFEGFVDDKPFDGNQAVDYEIILGSKAFIPGFEDQLLGHKVNEKFEINVVFPEDYPEKLLAGKNAVFKIEIKKIYTGVLPDLDEKFAEKYGIKTGKVVDLKQDIKQQMELQLKNSVDSLNRDFAFDLLKSLNKFDLPESLIENEIYNLKHELFHRLYGKAHHENEKIPDFPRELFLEKAKNQVHFGILLSEYISHNKLVASQEQVDAKLKELVAVYENSEDIEKQYRDNEEKLSQIEIMVLEKNIAQRVCDNAKVNNEFKSYKEVMNMVKGN